MSASVWMSNTPPAWLVITALLLRSEEHTSELQSLTNLVCRLLLENKYSPASLKLSVPQPRFFFCHSSCALLLSVFFFFNDTPPPEISPLPLPAVLPPPAVFFSTPDLGTPGNPPPLS